MLRIKSFDEQIARIALYHGSVRNRLLTALFLRGATSLLPLNAESQVAHK